MLKSIESRVSQTARAGRGDLFKRVIVPKSTDRILDLGGGNGAHFHGILPEHKNVLVADHCAEDLAEARERFGYQTQLLDATDEDGLPFEDNEFDIVFCSSVIEHVTGPKDEAIATNSHAEFAKTSEYFQNRFASEIARVGKRYWVQTPYRYFPVEAHTKLPVAIIYTPRPFQRAFLRSIRRFWISDTQPDWHLLNRRDMTRFFPDGHLEEEKMAGLTKSLIAVKA